MVIIGRSYKLIALGSEQVNCHFPENFFFISDITSPLWVFSKAL